MNLDGESFRERERERERKYLKEGKEMKNAIREKSRRVLREVTTREILERDRIFEREDSVIFIFYFFLIIKN
jgi:hypothetical protein